MATRADLDETVNLVEKTGRRIVAERATSGRRIRQQRCSRGRGGPAKHGDRISHEYTLDIRAECDADSRRVRSELAASHIRFTPIDSRDCRSQAAVVLHWEMSRTLYGARFEIGDFAESTHAHTDRTVSHTRAAASVRGVGAVLRIGHPRTPKTNELTENQ
jgi:hypothetical protein